MIGALGAPAISFAQTDGPVTRAQVKAELARLEQAGYDPTGSGTDYPVGMRAAEAQLARHGTDHSAPGYGGQREGTSESGTR